MSSRAYYLANREKVKAAAAAYRDAHRNEIKVRATERRRANAEEIRAKAKASREARPDAHRKRARAYYKAKRARDPKIYQEYSQEYYAANRDRIKARVQDYRVANPEKIRLRNAGRRARKAGASGKHTAADIAALMIIQGGKCAHLWCRKSIKTRRHVDHIMPLMLRGTNDRRNLQLLCVGCNTSKGSKHPVDFANQHGLLV